MCLKLSLFRFWHGFGNRLCSCGIPRSQYPKKIMHLQSQDTLCQSPLPIEATLSVHAKKRMNARNLGIAAVKAALDFGRIVRTRGAVVYALGQKEVRRYSHIVKNLQRFEGVHVVCGADGTIITVYRNHSFKKLRPGLGFCYNQR